MLQFDLSLLFEQNKVSVFTVRNTIDVYERKLFKIFSKVARKKQNHSIALQFALLDFEEKKKNKTQKLAVFN